MVLRWDTKADASIEWDGFNLDVESLSVGVLPGAADSHPDGVSAFGVADVICGVAWCFRG